MRTALVTATMIMTTAAAVGAPLASSASNATPFAFTVKGAADMPDRSATVVTIDVATGKADVLSAEFHCVLKNRKGFTWQARGKALNLRSNETRTVRLVADSDANSRDATKVDCVVTGFSAPALETR